LVRDGFEAMKNRGVVGQQSLSQDGVARGGTHLADVGAGSASGKVGTKMKLRS